MSLKILSNQFIFVLSTKTNDLKFALMRKMAMVVPQTLQLIAQRGFWLVLILALGTTMEAQGWQLTFGGNKEDRGVLVRETVDHGFIVLGFSESFDAIGDNNSDFDIYVIRTDIDGTVIWTKVYDEGFLERPADVLILEDGGYMIVGTIRPTVISDDQVFLLNIDKRGNKRWSKTIESDTDDAAVAIKPAVGGEGYIILGSSYDKTKQQDDDVLLLEVNEEGQELWRQTIGGQSKDQAAGIVPVTDGYIIAGNSPIEGGILNNIVLRKVDVTGSPVWTKSYGEANKIEQSNDLILDKDNNLVITGTEQFQKVLIGKFDLNGDSLWIKSHQFSPIDNVGKRVIQLEEDYVVVGFAGDDESNSDFLVARFDNDGEVVWNSLIGESDKGDFGESIQSTQDGGFIVTGFNGADFNFINDLILIKLDGTGNVLTNEISGTVSFAAEGCSTPDSLKTPLNEWLVLAESADETYFITTDTNGFYTAKVDTGTYTVKVLPPNNLWDVCEPEIYIVALNEFYDTTDLDFDVTSGTDCPAMQVDVTTPFIVNCENAIYAVSYCNLGPVAGT